MGTSISETQLSQLSDFVSDRMGLHFSKERWRYLKDGISSAAKEFGFEDTGECVKWLISSPLTKSQIEVLAGYLTVGETYFFREKRDFEVLESRLFPELIHSREKSGERFLRIWSAGCASGEEPYSIAILLNKLIPDLQQWRITILATDINHRFLHKASHGIYNEWSFRNTPFWVRDGYFKKTDKRQYEIVPKVKEMVTFSYLNLVEDVYPSLVNNTNAMDAIFCRNVLMYFNGENSKKVVNRFYKSIVDGGWLIVSPAEASQELFSTFAADKSKALYFYSKDSTRPVSAPSYYPAYKETAAPLTFESISRPEPAVVFYPEAAPQRTEAVPPKVEETMPEIKPNLYDEAQASYEQGLYAEAEGRLTALLSAEKGNWRGMALLAKVYANQGRLAEALEWSQKAIAADRLNPCCYYLRATILQEEGQGKEAVKSLKQAIYLDPGFVLAHFSLGTLSRQQGRITESNRYLDNTLSLLKGRGDNDILPESEGMTAGRIVEIVELMRDEE